MTRIRPGGSRARLRRLGATVGLLLGSGCSAEFESRLGTYEAAVATITGAPLETDPGLDPTPPRRRQVLLAVDTPTIGVFDLLSIQGCRLGELAGYRNSPMGRVMPATRRLGYELDVLATGHRCLPGLADARRERIQALLDMKRAALERHLWNALWTTPELEAWLAPAPAPLAGRPLGDAMVPLRRIQRRLENGLADAADARAVEAELASLRDIEPLGLPLRRLDRVARTLSRVAVRVAEFGSQGCQPTEVRLASSFESNYLHGLQSDIADLDRNVAPVLDPLHALYQKSRGALPLDAAVVEYHERTASPTATEGVWPRYRAAMRTHAQAWAPTLRACDRLPHDE